ncbi:MAG: carboxypeptidase-like regulatory domain-containing protein [Acidobacteriota bacterium]|nr:carboxypeptidase-like regulatory domain-containing protein [Acidobacteriota bacterium]
MPNTRRFPRATKALAVAVTFMLALGGLIPPGASSAAPQPKVSWSEKHVSVEVSPGGGMTKQVTFKSDQNLSNVTVEAVPELAGLVSVQPNTINSVFADQSQTVTLFFSAPADTPLGVREGTIHVRSGSQTIPQPLKVSVNVKEGVVIENLPDPDDVGSPAEVTLSGVSTTTFNPRPRTISFNVAGASLNAAAPLQVFVNGFQAPAAALQVTSNSVTFSVTLADGRNDLTLFASDTEGRMVHNASTVWAGGNFLNVSVLDEAGQPATGALVTLRLGDDKEVKATGTSQNGGVAFANVPARTVIVEASASGNRIASASAFGAEGFVQLRLKGFNALSAIDNNDFSQGTAGWEIGSAPVQIVPHEEGVFVPIGSASAAQPSAETQASFAAQSEEDSSAAVAADSDPAALRAERHARLQAGDASAPAQTEGEGGTEGASFSALSAEEGDNDLVLNTAGEGPQTISRTFQAEPGTQEVKVRYKFVTTEVPGGYFGTQFNDSFSISVRTQAEGGAATESQTMNGLGLAAFDAGGATDWREFTLPVNENGDVVQVDVSVANVADGLLDSQLVLDFVAKTKVSLGGLTAVIKDGTESVEVKMSGTAAPVTLTLVTAAGTTGAAQFTSTGSATMTVSQTTNVEIKGVTESSKHNNIRLVAKDAGGEELDHEDFCVLWVTMSISFSGSVSSDNSKKNNIQAAMGTTNLGQFFSTGTTSSHHWRQALEIKGTVAPSDFEEKIKIVRWRIESKYYDGSTLDTTAGGGAKDDTSPDSLRDDEPAPNGRVYDFDAPGVQFVVGKPVGSVYRQRANFRQWAEYKGKKASAEITWFTRMSIEKTAGQDVLKNDVPNDNVHGLGSTPTTWNLQP